jgi:hypothetical protein
MVRWCNVDGPYHVAVSWHHALLMTFFVGLFVDFHLEHEHVYIPTWNFKLRTIRDSLRKPCPQEQFSGWAMWWVANLCCCNVCRIRTTTTWTCLWNCSCQGSVREHSQVRDLITDPMDVKWWLKYTYFQFCNVQGLSGAFFLVQDMAFSQKAS